MSTAVRNTRCPLGLCSFFATPAQDTVWFIAWAIPLFIWQLGPWAWTSVIVPLIWSATRRELLQAVAMYCEGPADLTISLASSRLPLTECVSGDRC